MPNNSAATRHVSGLELIVPGKRPLLICGIAFIVIAAFAAVDATRPDAYLRVCNLYRDLINRFGRTTEPNPNLVFLAIDNSSVTLDEDDINDLFSLRNSDSTEAHALRLMSRHYPWPREVYALVLERLIQAGARVVAFDLTFPSPSDDDTAFRAALNRHADRVVIASNFVDQTLTRPTDALIPQTSPIDSRVGYANFWADDDGVVRRARYHTTFEQVREIKPRPDAQTFSSLAAVALTKAGYSSVVPADIDDHVLRFTAFPRQGFPPRSLFEIFVPAYWQRKYDSGEFFRDKIVIVGAEGNWLHDEHRTPLGDMPGAEMHLNAMNAALHHQFLRELPPVGRSGCCLIAGAIAILLSLGVRLPWLRFVTAIAVSALAIAIGCICFNQASVYLPMVAPVTEMNAIVLLGLVCDFTSERREKARIRRTLERYVSRDVVHQIIDRPENYGQNLGGVVRPAAILFSDIRAYSVVTTQSTPEALVTQLNEYFTAMVECVFQCGGTLDKFIGDALMAVWGTLQTRGASKDAALAVEAALLMRQQLVQLNRGWREKGWPELRFGIGINHGEVVVGNIGSPQRMEFTVIGNAVNLSWRLQELTKKAGSDILLSSTVATLIADQVNVRPVAGMTHGSLLQAYEICGSDSAPPSTAPSLPAALSAPPAASVPILH